MVFKLLSSSLPLSVCFLGIIFYYVQEHVVHDFLSFYYYFFSFSCYFYSFCNYLYSLISFLMSFAVLFGKRVSKSFMNAIAIFFTSKSYSYLYFTSIYSTMASTTLSKVSPSYSPFSLLFFLASICLPN